MPYNLIEYRRNNTSQFGEDGIIEKLFSIIPPKYPYCAEIGAWDGKAYSNTFSLIQNGWSSTQIESDGGRYNSLVALHKGNSRVKCIQELVEPEGENNLDLILTRSGAPRDMDFLVIDIDGGDYQMWSSLQIYKPRVVMIEANNSIPANVELVGKRGSVLGASALSLYLLGQSKGYTMVCYNTMNCFFVLDDLVELLDLKSKQFTYLFTIGQTEQPYFSVDYKRHIWNYGVWPYDKEPLSNLSTISSQIQFIKVRIGEEAWI